MLDHLTLPEARVSALVRVSRVALEELGAVDTARLWLDELVALAPRHVDGLTLLADTLERQEEPQALADVLCRLEGLGADTQRRVETSIRLARLQVETLGVPAEARATLNRLPATAIGDPRVRQLREAMGMEVPAMPWETSGDASRRTGESQAPSGDAWSRILALADAGRNREALAMISSAMVTADAELQRALDELRAVLQGAAASGSVAPQEAAHGPQVQQARALMVAGSLDAAQAMLEAILKAAPRLISALDLQAALFLERGNFEALVATLERLADAAGSRESALAYLREQASVLGDVLGDEARAMAVWRRISALDCLDDAASVRLVRHHTECEAWGALVEFHAQRAQVAMARADVTKAVQSRADEAYVWLTHLDDAEAAAIACHAGLALEPEHAGLLELALKAHQSTGDEDAVQTFAERLLPHASSASQRKKLQRLMKKK